MTKPKAPTLRQFQDRFPTEEACLEHLMETRYGLTHECEKCGREAQFHAVTKRRSYACHWCGHQVFPTADTPMHRTRTSLRDWFYVMFLFCASRNGVSAKEVERQIGVTYKTAWRMCHEIRKYMSEVDGDTPIGGPGKHVEIDEAQFGGVNKAKTIVMGMAERGGDVLTKIVPNVRRASLLPHIDTNVIPGGAVHTDELRSYGGLHKRGHRHMTVNHSAGEYVGFQGASVNAMEGFWAQVKRSINGTHIHVSGRHLWKYLAEFEYRWNMRRCPHLMLDRLLTAFPR
ncbi:MAG: IS1595 family transposase [Pseudomonadota bacterium]